MKTKEQRAAEKLEGELKKLAQGKKVSSATCREFLGLSADADGKATLQALHNRLHELFADYTDDNLVKTLTSLEAASQLCQSFLKRQ